MLFEMLTIFVRFLALMVCGWSLLCQKRQVTFLMVKFFNFRAFSEITIIKVRALACELENSTNYCPSAKTLNLL